MTEDEAKTKWCPFAKSRTITYARVGGSKACTTYMLNEEDVPTTTCIASACMAWRRSDGDPGCLERNEGYCGLAGHGW